MKKYTLILLASLMAFTTSFANDITGVWVQNPYLHEGLAENYAIVYWQFTEDGHFVYEESNCGALFNALRGHYTLSGSSLNLVVDEMVFHYTDDNEYDDMEDEAEYFAVGTTAAINVTATGDCLTFSANPFVEVGTLTLDRISSYSKYSPEDILPGCWELFWMTCSGNLDPDEDSATRLNPDHTMSYVWEDSYGTPYYSYVSASGSWSLSDNNLCFLYENVNTNDPDGPFLNPGQLRTLTIIICCPERISYKEETEISVGAYMPYDGDLIEKYFGGVGVVNTDPSPRITANGGVLQIENADNALVVVFDIDGKTIVNRQSYDGKPITLPSGQYIVKVNGSIFKVSL